VYAQFEIWKENAIWGEQRESPAYPSAADPPPYPAYGRYAPSSTASSEQTSSYCDMAYVLQVKRQR